MTDITFKAVVKQVEAMKCTAHRIGIFDRKAGKMINKDSLEFGDILRMIPWLKYQNFTGKDIYIRPAGEIDRALLRVDDLTRQGIRAMGLRGMAPACVVETSPHNYQAWVSLGPEPMPPQERQVAARLLAEQFYGDSSSADASHYGRLAGFTNRKDSRLTVSGHPFVACREANGLDAARSRELREWAAARCRLSGGPESPPRPSCASGQERLRRPSRDGPGSDPSAAFLTYYSQWVLWARANGKSMDASRGDFAVVCRMLKEGYDEVQIGIALSNNSPDIEIRKKNHIDDYVKRTIAAAKRLSKQ